MIYVLDTDIGPMDLKIAAIVLAFDAVPVTRNVTDFRKIPGLWIENWALESE